MTTTHAGLDALRHALPADTERGAHHYAIDGINPSIAFAPTDRAEVATLLRIAAQQSLSVIPHGGRTALALGRPLTSSDVALDLKGLHRIVSYVPDDLTVTVEAGITLNALQRELAEHGQYLTVDAPPDGHVTIGGLLATARSGAWRGHLPAARDLVLGIEVVMPSGELVKSGGRVVKNVTGYDMHRMHTGALGAFGVIVEATFKLAPLPTVTRTVAATTDALADAVILAREVWDASLSIRAITVLPADTATHVGLPARPAVLVELAGGEAAVDRSTRDLARLGEWSEAPTESWAYLRRLHGDAASTVIRLGIPPTAIDEALNTTRITGALTWAHVAGGQVIIHFADPEAIDAATITRLRTFTEARGGYLQVESATPALRTAIDPANPGDAILVAALRDRFDAKHTINPGRWGTSL